jgi:hypothetical protein
MSKIGWCDIHYITLRRSLVAENIIYAHMHRIINFMQVNVDGVIAAIKPPMMMNYTRFQPPQQSMTYGYRKIRNELIQQWNLDMVLYVTSLNN